jgi:hypothetical protein
MASSVSNPVQECPGKVVDEPVDPDKKWIKFLVKDDKGKPLPNIQLNVILPDGSREEKVTDQDGMIEIKNIDAGDCKLDVDWRSLHVGRAVHV